MFGSQRLRYFGPPTLRLKPQGWGTHRIREWTIKDVPIVTDQLPQCTPFLATPVLCAASTTAFATLFATDWSKTPGMM
jgi:hypothetical protein